MKSILTSLMIYGIDTSSPKASLKDSNVYLNEDNNNNV